MQKKSIQYRNVYLTSFLIFFIKALFLSFSKIEICALMQELFYSKKSSVKINVFPLWKPAVYYKKIPKTFHSDSHTTYIKLSIQFISHTTLHSKNYTNTSCLDWAWTLNFIQIFQYSFMIDDESFLI
jgi:hypothetical protein